MATDIQLASSAIPPQATVDYLTVTTKTSEESMAMIDQLYKLLTPEFVTRETNKPWSFKGFHGRSYPGVRFGLREDAAIIMLSGPFAALFWGQISPYRSKCTRIDLAVTVTLPLADTQVAQRAYMLGGEARARNLTFVSNSRGGSTTYLGSRFSETYARLYDKSAERGDEPGKVWRYEVETKKPKSEAYLSELLRQNSPSLWIAAYVHTYFLTRGIVPLFSASNIDTAIEIEARVTSKDKQLAWLAGQVKPTVAKLIIAGFEEDARLALGLMNKPDLSRLLDTGE